MLEEYKQEIRTILEIHMKDYYSGKLDSFAEMEKNRILEIIASLGK